MRIASLSPAATEILFGLGLGKHAEHVIVCVDQFSNFPEEAKSIPHVRGMIDIDAEEIRKFQPDIVMLGTSIQAKLAVALREEGFTVIFDDPRALQQIEEWIRSLGAIVGCEAAAKELIERMRRGFNDVKKKAAVMRGRSSSSGSDAPKVRLYVEEWPALPGSSGRHDPPYASGNWVPEIARIAGGEQMPIPSIDHRRDASLMRLSAPVTLEEVQAWDPDLIVISWCGAGILAPKELLLKRPEWNRLRAVQQGNVRVIDDSLLNRPGPRLVEGAQRLYGWIFEMLH